MSEDKRCIGGLVGKSTGGKIINCHVSGKIAVSGKDGSSAIGGLVGEAIDTDIINSSADVTIENLDEGLFLELKELLQENVKDKIERKNLLRLVDKMKKLQNKPIEFGKVYDKFISAAAKHITIIDHLLLLIEKFVSQ